MIFPPSCMGTFSGVCVLSKNTSHKYHSSTFACRICNRVGSNFKPFLYQLCPCGPIQLPFQSFNFLLRKMGRTAPVLYSCWKGEMQHIMKITHLANVLSIHSPFFPSLLQFFHLFIEDALFIIAIDKDANQV